MKIDDEIFSMKKTIEGIEKKVADVFVTVKSSNSKIEVNQKEFEKMVCENSDLNISIRRDDEADIKTNDENISINDGGITELGSVAADQSDAIEELAEMVVDLAGAIEELADIVSTLSEE